MLQNKLYEKIHGDLIQCNLCPHFCVLKKGQYGKCSIRKSDGDKIYLDNYGYLTNIASEPIEKKPILHFMSGTKTLSISGHSCNLSCVWCENFQISQKNRKKDSKYFELDSIIKMAKDEECSSICMTYNEPTISYEYLIDLANKCHKNNLKFIIKTNAYINKEPWLEICKVVDAMNVDYKGTQIQYKEVMGVDGYVVKDRIKEAYDAGVHIEISIPVYSGFMEDVRAFWNVCSFLSNIDRKMPCHLLNIVETSKYSQSDLNPKKEMAAARNILTFYMDRVYKG